MKTQKTYCFGETTDRQKKYEEEDLLLRKKWNNDFENGKIPLGNITPERSGIKINNKKKNKQVIENANNEIEIIETCMRCNEAKPITPLYFHTEFNNSGIGNIEKNSGKEQISNTPTYGCRECARKISQNKSKTIDEYIRILLKPYPELKKEWYNNLPNICEISNIQLNEQNNVDWRVSIQNNGKTKVHLPETCCKIAYEFNVQEHNAIKNLIDCWKEAFGYIIKELHEPTNTTELIQQVNNWWNNSPKENGVNLPSQIIENGVKKRNPEYSKQYNSKHLPAIISDLLFRYKKMDKKSKRNPTTSGICINKIQLFEKLIKQNFMCYYTGIPFSQDRDNWRYFSLERLNNTLNHTDENSVFICRMFNTAGQLNRKKILTALLSQIHISLSIEDKDIINTELQNI